MSVFSRELDNGMRIIVDEVAHFDSVAISFWINVGSKFESDANQGMSHFLEHMMFKGTKKRSAMDIAVAFDNIGGNFNACTSRDYTVCYAKVLKKHFSIAMDIIADIVLDSVFSEEEIEREKIVIAQEMHEVNDNPSDIVFDKYFEAAYSGQQFGRSILGTLDVINSFTKKDFSDYVKLHYIAKNSILSVAGNISLDEVVLQSEVLFKNLPTTNPTKVVAPVYTGGVYKDHRDIGQLNLILGFQAFSYHDKRFYALKVIEGILGGGMSSRLFQEVREKRGLAYSIYSSSFCHSDTGTFFIYAATEPKYVHELIKVVGREVSTLCSTLKIDEFNRVVDRMCFEVEMSREGVHSMAEASGSCLSSYGRYITKDELKKNIKSVTLDEVIQTWEFITKQVDKITISAVGDVSIMPDKDTIVSLFKG